MNINEVINKHLMCETHLKNDLTNYIVNKNLNILEENLILILQKISSFIYFDTNVKVLNISKYNDDIIKTLWYEKKLNLKDFEVFLDNVDLTDFYIVDNKNKLQFGRKEFYFSELNTMQNIDIRKEYFNYCSYKLNFYIYEFKKYFYTYNNYPNFSYQILTDMLVQNVNWFKI